MLKLRKKTCPFCRRKVSVLEYGNLATHGPGRNGDFFCPGSDQKPADIKMSQRKVTNASR